MTEYRHRFNDIKSFHRDSTIHRTRTLPKRISNLHAD